MSKPTDPITGLLDRLPAAIEKELDSGGWSPLYGIIAGAGLAIARSIDRLTDAVLDHTDPAEPTRPVSPACTCPPDHTAEDCPLHGHTAEPPK